MLDKQIADLREMKCRIDAGSIESERDPVLFRAHGVLYELWAVKRDYEEMRGSALGAEAEKEHEIKVLLSYIGEKLGVQGQDGDADGVKS
jgi:hypothetical protein